MSGHSHKTKSQAEVEDDGTECSQRKKESQLVTVLPSVLCVCVCDLVTYIS